MNTPGTAAAVCTTNSDAALACSIVAGEPGAFERLMREHNRRLFRVARSILRDDVPDPATISGRPSSKA